MFQARVLVVDDDPDTVEIVAEILKKDFSEVVIAVGGAEGLRSAKAKTPDLVITDVQMPDVSGIEFLEKLKEAKIETRVIFFTAYQKNLQDTVAFMKMGVCDVLHKPLESSVLVSAAKRSLALDSPLSLYQSEPWTILKKAMQENSELTDSLGAASVEMDAMRKKLKTLERQEALKGVAARLIYLTAGAALTVLLYRLKMIDRGSALYVLPLLLFVLLSLPIDQIKTFIAKWQKMEGRATFK